MSPPSLAELATTLNRLQGKRQSLSLNAFGDVEQSVTGMVGFMRSTGGPYFKNPDNLALIPFRCGTEDGLVMGVFTGNYKDMGTAVAAGACAAELALAFSTPLLSEADIVPALRKWILDSDERIHEFSQISLEGFQFATVTKERSDLRGIGCSTTVLAVLSNRLYGVHLGEGKAFLLRNGQSKKLTVEHTLAHDPAYRAGDHDFPNPELIVLKVLGINEGTPDPLVFRADLKAGDRVVVGNLELADEHMSALEDRSAKAMVTTLLDRIAKDQAYPAAVGCVRLYRAKEFDSPSIGRDTRLKRALSGGSASPPAARSATTNHRPRRTSSRTRSDARVAPVISQSRS